MSTLKYVGKTVQSDITLIPYALPITLGGGVTPNAGFDLVDEDYISTLIAGNLSQGTVDSLVSAALSPYATVTYANNAMSTLATPAYVISTDANYVPLSTIGQPSGPIALDAGGKVPVGLITTSNTQRWPAPFWTPAAYASGPLSATSTATQLFTHSQPDPGFTYKLFCTGMIDTSVSLDNGEYPQVLIRQGSTTGPIVASGSGVAESYPWGQFTFSTVTDASTLNPAVWAQNTPAAGATPINCYPTRPEVYMSAGVNSGVIDTQRARCLDPISGTTIGDNQVVTMTIGRTAPVLRNDTSYYSSITLSSNDIYVRMDGTGASYVRCKLDGVQASLFYKISGGAEVQIGTKVTCPIAANDVYVLYCGTVSSSLQFLLYKNGSLLHTWNDSGGASAIGAGNRGWGFGMGLGRGYYAAAGLWYEANPAYVLSLVITDPANAATQNGSNSGMVTIIPTPIAAQSPLTGSTTLYAMLSSSGSSATVNSSTFQQSLWVMPVPQ